MQHPNAAADNTEPTQTLKQGEADAARVLAREFMEQVEVVNKAHREQLRILGAHRFLNPAVEGWTRLVEEEEQVGERVRQVCDAILNAP